ncbi:FAD-dependent oxidoreductase [Lysobacter korlensis]|uniref:FAD-dependent oxidoreductase n=1 Tax=Lysobacter korlensis TaxID=553636 RepID=A0ABV6RU14_9GAMM
MSKAAARWAIVAVIVLAVLAAWHGGLLAELDLGALKARQQALQEAVAARPLASAAAFFALYVAVTAISLPGAAIMTLAAGALFGLLEGTLLVSFASSIGATLAFLASRFVLRDSIRARYRERLQGFDRGIERDGAYYLFTLRLVPVVPFFLVNLLAGLTALRAGTFYLVSQVGMLPGTIAYVYAGTQLARIESPADVLSPGLLAAFAVLGLLPLVMRWLVRLWNARRIYRGHRRPQGFDYNLIVIGAGSAGLVSAYIAASARAKVALIERDRMGGDCLNTGCVPSKTLLHAARQVANARRAERDGLARVEVDVDFARTMERVQAAIARIEPHDSPERYRGLGVDVIAGDARVVSPWEVEVGGRRLSARSLVIATGARPRVPDLPGIDGIEVLTSENLWSLRTRPGRLVVLGGGPIGCELGQAFVRLGSAVTLVERGERLLAREDADAAAVVEASLRDDGIELLTGWNAVRIERGGDGQGGTLVCERGAEQRAVPFDRLLVALGRQANVSGFGLEELGVEVNENGTLAADAMLRTNYPNILVAGDVTGPYQFTHVASHQAWYAALNGLIAPFWRFKVDYRVIPWATFTDPELARVGLSEDEARERGIDVEVTRYALAGLDRAIAEDATAGFVKVLTEPGRDRILGATIVGAQAGELIASFVIAMKHKLGLRKLLGTIHIYPTMSEANKNAAGAWQRAHAPDRLLRLAARFFDWRR